MLKKVTLYIDHIHTVDVHCTIITHIISLSTILLSPHNYIQTKFSGPILSTNPKASSTWYKSCVIEFVIPVQFQEKTLSVVFLPNSIHVN